MTPTVVTPKIPTLDIDSETQKLLPGRLQLLAPTPPEWAEIAAKNFSHFLKDHAACERKASASALSFVVKYKDKTELVEAMIALAREELEHFEQVCKLLHSLGLEQGADEKDSYVNDLLKGLKTEPQERFLDRLVISAIMEARGCERFGLMAQKLTDPKLALFYDRLSRAEAKHQLLFIQLAEKYFPSLLVKKRLDELLQLEARCMLQKPLAAKLY